MGPTSSENSISFPTTKVLLFHIFLLLFGHFRKAVECHDSGGLAGCVLLLMLRAVVYGFDLFREELELALSRLHFVLELARGFKDLEAALLQVLVLILL